MSRSALNQLKRVSVSFAPLACVLFFSLSLATLPAASAQQALFDSRAEIMISSIKKAGGTKILVCDFSGPKGLNDLGMELADEFSASITRASGGAIATVDRSRLPQLLHQLGLEREHAGSDLEGAIAAGQLSADDFVSGKLSTQGDEATIQLELHSLDSDQPIESLEASFILGSEAKKLLDTEFHDTPQSTYPFAGSDGYSTPVCMFCPTARYTNAAARDKVQGKVVLMMLVSAEGKIENAYSLKSLPGGLTQASITAVKDWRLKPATAPNGIPAEVRQTVDMVFHLN